MKIVLDTNIWISFLLGKVERNYLRKILTLTMRVQYSDHLLKEIARVSNLPKIKKSVSDRQVESLLILIKKIGAFHEPPHLSNFEAAPNDEFLLDLSAASNADYLVTGDKALLELEQHEQTKVISLSEFKELLEK